MSTEVPVKSILKQPSQPPQKEEEDAQKAAAAKNKRHLDIALQHAYLIQHQKDTQNQILKHLEILIDWPASSTPTPKEASDFLRLITIFQPSDFDDLVEERRIDAKCGYPLCLDEPRGRKLKDSESWKLKKGAADYCSNACMKKALFVKAQLSPTPAWERIPGQHPVLQLHEDDRYLVPAAGQGQEAQMLKQRAAEKRELAMERGEQATSFRPNQVMLDQIVEKTPGARQTAEKEGKVQSAASATAIEGYEPGGPVPKKSTQRPIQTPLPSQDSTAPVHEPAEQPKPASKADADSSADSSEEEVDEDDEQQWRDMLAHVRQQR